MMRRIVPLALAAAAMSGCLTWILRPGADAWDPPPAPATAREITPRERCAQRTPLRRALFGDLHVHTSYSMDARSRDMLGTPEDAYRFARGEPIGLGPFDEQGRGTRTARLERPLDFAAVTDHAEWIAEVTLCTTPGSPAFESERCRGYRGEAPVPAPIPGVPSSRMIALIGAFGRPGELCGPGDAWCRETLASAWQAIQQATERFHDRSAACSFTTFHGWEYSNSPGRSKVHRNVIFRNEMVPELPVSSLEEPDPVGLWERLDALCNETGSGCQAIAIPHNPNLSNGRMFTVRYRDEPEDEQRRQAALRARLEPVVEMMQVKGESECKNGLFQVAGEDELCDFEKVRGPGRLFPDCEEEFGTGAIAGRGCESRLDFVRYALIEGIREEQRIGVNPYRFGFVGSTDTHNATPGDVEERSFQGCCANKDSTAEARLDPTADFAGRSRVHRNPGGLMGVWAEENSREALFDAIQRRETFATSGPRIAPRFFAAWDLPADACDAPDPARVGAGAGIAMGSVLPERPPDAGAPAFLVSALRDPGTRELPGGALQRLQIVKVWLGDDGRFHQTVHDVAGGPNGAGVDTGTCEPRGAGHDALCAVWSDPGFEPARDAAYYLRVVENPSCRWSWRACLALPEGQRPSTCSDPEVPRTIQERAWTSPVWYRATDPAPVGFIR